MATMKAVHVPHAGGAFKVVERTVLELEPCQVRVKMQACGVCHSAASDVDGIAIGKQFLCRTLVDALRSSEGD
jgi:D-arabinose 1-dehydrogenase-like Zn-dependent alcohol dehydrogenase